jgi:hypothetical protein
MKRIRRGRRGDVRVRPIREQKINLLIAAALAAILLGAPIGRFADLILSGRMPHAAARSVGRAQDGAEHGVTLGGIVLERNRHAVAGGVMGCVVGAVVGAGVGVVASVFTAGSGLALIPTAGAVGCGMAGMGGIVIGYPLDDYVNDLDD